MSFFTTHADRLTLPIQRGETPGLRAAQIGAVHSVAAHFWKSDRPGLVVMPTGSGKTAVILASCLALRAERALVVVPSKLLRQQLVQKFRDLDPLHQIGALRLEERPNVAEVTGRLSESSSWEELRAFDVVVGTPQSVSPEADQVAAPPADLFDVVVFDEGHHFPARTWNAISEAFPASRRLLFTATPFRLDQKAISAELVFRYELAQARSDGVFGEVEYVPVAISKGATADEAIAKAAAAALLADREKGLVHWILVRAEGKKRASEVLKVYEKATTLKLKAVHSGLSAKTVRKTMEELRGGDLDGVVAVDMLGEGIDLPNLKIAALHAPHRSLAVTLQFIGRFARTSDDVGKATFFAVPSEIEGDAADLFVAGAEWNELVAALSRDRIDREEEIRTISRSFAPVAVADVHESALAEQVVRSLRPYFHVKVYETAGTVNLHASLPLPRGVEPLLDLVSDAQGARICLGRSVSPLRWCRHDGLLDVAHSLFVLVYVAESKLLFICTTMRDNAVYDALVESVAGQAYVRLAPAEITRVLRGVKGAEFFSVGMRNRAGFAGGGAESYRMISGRNADRAVRDADTLLYNRGHAFGRGTENGGDVTIGFSSASKVWANRRDLMPELLKWIHHIARKLVDAAPVKTGSGLDKLGSPTRLNETPEVVAGSLPERAFSTEGAVVRFPGPPPAEAPLADLEVRILDGKSDPVVFEVVASGDARARFSFSVGSGRMFRGEDEAARQLVVIDGGGRTETSAEDWLNEHPISFLTPDLARVDGNAIAKAPSPGTAPLVQVECVDWLSDGIDPCKEKPDGEVKDSLFHYVEAQLLAGPAEVVFLDDGAGEMADYVSVEPNDGRPLVRFFHCKAASSDKNVPNDSIDEVYEVSGQAIKTLRWTDARRLVKQVEHRDAKTKSEFRRGDLAALRALTANAASVEFEVIIVQPAVGDAPKEAVAHLLSGVDTYLRAGNVRPLRVWGTKAKAKDT